MPRLPTWIVIPATAALLFGGLTLIFDDPRFLKIKPTVMNSLFGLALLGGLVLRKNPLKLVLGDAFDMPDTVWRRLTVRYAGMFFALAALNEAVWRTQPDTVWVMFRFPGLMLLTLVFTLSQVPLLMRYVKAEDLPPPPTE